MPAAEQSRFEASQSHEQNQFNGSQYNSVTNALFNQFMKDQYGRMQRAEVKPEATVNIGICKKIRCFAYIRCTVNMAEMANKVAGESYAPAKQPPQH